MKKKLFFVFGTRPEAIKMAPVVLAAKAEAGFDVRVVVTAQHRQMLDQVLEAFGIVPDIDMNLMGQAQGPNDVAWKVIRYFDEIIERERPDMVFVHGDTTTTMATSLACFHRQVPVGHVEAGLRTFNLKAPFPEEMNRRVVGIVGSLHFAPTERARANLIKEGIPESAIPVVGNTVIDALNIISARLDSGEGAKDFEKRFPMMKNGLKTVLVTTHRRESFGVGIASICEAITEIVLRSPETQIVLPVHMNPSVRGPINEILGKVERVYLIEPQDYVAFIFLMKSSHLILTDSGGLQEEAPALGKPVLVMRETTERPEAVDAGCAVLVGTDKDKIVKGVLSLIENSVRYEQMARVKNPFGDGTAAKQIVSFLKSTTFELV
jgi:UDP-N-acetylglucosamine 2-epimerase